MGLVLGIDPGTVVTGYGLVEMRPETLESSSSEVLPVSYVFAQDIKLGKGEGLHQRLEALSKNLRHILERYRPNMMVIEKLFLGKNVDSAFKLGHARGVCIAECVMRGIPVCEYSSRYVKKVITGHGGSSKEGVRGYLEKRLGTTLQGLSLDASDALALAFCYSVLKLQKKESERPFEWRV